MKTMAILGVLLTGSWVSAAEPVMVVVPQQIVTPVAAPNSTSIANQTVMNQVINQLNRNQFQLAVAEARTAPPVILPALPPKGGTVIKTK